MNSDPPERTLGRIGDSNLSAETLALTRKEEYNMSAIVEMIQLINLQASQVQQLAQENQALKARVAALEAEKAACPNTPPPQK